MRDLFELLSNMNYYESDNGQGEGAGSDNDNNENQSQEDKPYKSFKDESEYLNTLKSERSKAKNDLMKELGISSVDEAKATFKKAGELEGELNTFKTKTSELEEQLTLTKNGVKDEYAEEALSLAKSKVGDDKDLSTALGEVIKKFPMMASKAQPNVNVGGDKGDNKDEETDQGKIKNHISKKRP